MTESSTNLAPLDVRMRISALWISMLMIFAYVDIFGFYRADVLEAALAGEVAGVGFTIDQTFLSLTLVYIAVPSLMVAATITLTPRLSRGLNLVLSPLYFLTVLGASIGEDYAYYLIGSLIEIVLLAYIGLLAWRWR